MEEFSFLLPLVTIAKFRYLRPSMKSLTSNQNTQYITCVVSSTSIVDARICEERGAVKNKSKVPADVELLTRPPDSLHARFPPGDGGALAPTAGGHSCVAADAVASIAPEECWLGAATDGSGGRGGRIRPYPWPLPPLRSMPPLRASFSCVSTVMSSKNSKKNVCWQQP